MREGSPFRVREHPLLSVFIFTLGAFLITWGTGMIVVLSTHFDLVHGANRVAHPIALPFPLAIILILTGGYGPALAAVVVTALESGRAGVRELLRQFLRWRVGLIWYAIALLGPALLGVIALGLTALLGGSTPAHWFSSPRPLRFLGLAFGPWGEELGWRGYAQPRLQRRFSKLTASLLVGVIWFCWHYWPVATPAGGPLIGNFPSRGAQLMYMLAASVLMAWLYNSTGGSLPVAWAAHAGLNLGQGSVQIHQVPFGYFDVVFCFAAGLVALLDRSRTKSPRGHES